MEVLAHYWGIDEIGVFVVPVLAALFVRRWAERRSRRKADESASNKTAEVD